MWLPEVGVDNLSVHWWERSSNAVCTWVCRALPSAAQLRPADDGGRQHAMRRRTKAPPQRNQVVFSVPLPQHQVVVPSMLYAPWREGLPPVKLDFKVPTVFL